MDSDPHHCITDPDPALSFFSQVFLLIIYWRYRTFASVYKDNKIRYLLKSYKNACRWKDPDLGGPKTDLEHPRKRCRKERLTFDTVNAGDHWDLTKKTRCYWKLSDENLTFNISIIKITGTWGCRDIWLHCCWCLDDRSWKKIFPNFLTHKSKKYLPFFSFFISKAEVEKKFSLHIFSTYYRLG